jgi:hypothetical protein
MFHDPAHLNTLATQKELLLAESELNREELLKDLHILQAEIKKVKHRVHTAGSVASYAALLAAAVALFRHEARPTETETQPKVSWLSSAINGASLFFKIKSSLRDKT